MNTATMEFTLYQLGMLEEAVENLIPLKHGVRRRSLLNMQARIREEIAAIREAEREEDACE